MHVRKK